MIPEIPMVTRRQALQRLTPYIGQELGEYVEQYGITINRNKGWKGQVLERLIGIGNNTRQAPNGLGFELKSVAWLETVNKPKETMAITMINSKEGLIEDFYRSHVWEKLKSIILCQVSWEKAHSKKSRLLGVSSLEMIDDFKLIVEIEEDYNLIRSKFVEGGISAMSSRDGKWIQARTKGRGGINARTGLPNPKTRAFYARKELIKRFQEASPGQCIY